MRFGEYRFALRCTADTWLPPYKGSTFRGVFGRALKQVVCALKKQTCETCLLRTGCLYPMVFETELAMQKDAASGFRPPHPFVLVPPLTEKNHFEPGDQLDFRLLLFGGMNEKIPYFIYAVQQMGKAGIGKAVNGARGRFELLRVDVGETALYRCDEERMRHIECTRHLSINGANDRQPASGKIKITFETPLRMKFNGRLVRELPFHFLVRAMLRRASGLMRFWGDGEPALDYKGLVKSAESVAIENSRLQWVDRRRYSHRQDSAMMLGGLTGSVSYSGDLAEFLPLLSFCEDVHIGKQTTFGLGRFRSEILP